MMSRLQSVRCCHLEGQRRRIVMDCSPAADGARRRSRVHRAGGSAGERRSQSGKGRAEPGRRHDQRAVPAEHESR